MMTFQMMNTLMNMGEDVAAMVKKELGINAEVFIDTFYESTQRGGYVTDENSNTKTIYLNMGCTSLAEMTDRDVIECMAAVVAHEMRHMYQIQNKMFDFHASLSIDWEKRPEEIDAEDYAWDWLDKNIMYIDSTYVEEVA